MSVRGHALLKGLAYMCSLSTALSGCSDGSRPRPDPTPSTTESAAAASSSPGSPKLCQPFPDSLIDEFMAAYNGRDLHALESLISVSSIEDTVTGAYVGDATFSGVAEWARSGWDEGERLNLVGYGAFHPSNQGFQMFLVRRSDSLNAHGIRAVESTLDAVSDGCSIVSLETSGTVQATERPCAFYTEYAEVADVRSNEPSDCRDGSGEFARRNAALVWTGDQALIWGGSRGGKSTYGAFRADGLAFDPTSQKWSEIPPLETSAFVPEVSTWTGSELLVMGGKVRGTNSIAAAYEPVARRWRAIDFPYPEWSGFTGVWSGRELILWGGPIRSSDPRRRGAIFDPAKDSWRTTSPAPISGRWSHSAIWTGSEMIVWGGSNARTDQVDGAAYNPATDTWRKIAPAPLTARQWLPLVWTGEEMIVWGGSSYSRSQANGAAYDPVLDSWRKLPPAPLKGRHYHSMSWTGSEVIVFGGYDYHRSFRDGAAYNPLTNAWRRLPRAPISQRCCHSATWTGKQMFVFGGTAKLGEMALGDGALYDPATDRWRRVVPSLTPECGVIELTDDDYETEIKPTSGPPGKVVRVSGPTLRGEDGRWAPSGRLEMWWNSEFPDRKRPIDAGPVLKLVEVRDMERCRFSAAFRVPDVPPGAYAISKHTWDSPPSQGYGTDPYHLFIVTH
jgi:Kelch motif